MRKTVIFRATAATIALLGVALAYPFGHLWQTGPPLLMHIWALGMAFGILFVCFTLALLLWREG